jgi:hypothetical protein
MKPTAIALACALALAASPAAARSHHHHHRASTGDPRPSAWCGWYARHNLVDHDPGKLFNQARAWARWGIDAGGPAIGVIVVWAHHVGKIVGHAAEGWEVLSGNDGHRVRRRVRSMRGVIAYRRQGITPLAQM